MIRWPRFHLAFERDLGNTNERGGCKVVQRQDRDWHKDWNITLHQPPGQTLTGAASEVPRWARVKGREYPYEPHPNERSTRDTRRESVENLYRLRKWWISWGKVTDGWIKRWKSVVVRNRQWRSIIGAYIVLIHGRKIGSALERLKARWKKVN